MFPFPIQRARHRGAWPVITALVLLAAACGSSGKGSAPSTTPSSTSTTASSTSSVPPAAVPVTIYFVKAEHLAAAGRTVTAATPDAAVRALLAGPNGSVERDLGFSSAIPAGTKLNSVAVANNVATVDLSGEFASGGGSLSMQERVAQVVFTLTQFPNVTHVRFRLDGTPTSTIGGEGLMVDNVDRSTFENVTPFILVESPTPGQAVSSPLTIRGMSNTFEATVNYTISDPNGKVLAEGHTTATAGSGTWGTFTVDAVFTNSVSGFGRVTVYEISPKDGAHVHGTSIPVEMS